MSSSTTTTIASNTLNKVKTSMDQNQLDAREYYGIVVENKLPGDGNRVRFYIPELTPLVEGDLKDNLVPISRTYKDPRGRKITVRGKTNNNFEAIYQSSDSYRKTPPDVQRGERIIVWQKDVDIWYWKPTSLDSVSKRRLETVIQSVNADKPTGPESGKHGDENIYYVENSSHNKTYTISTSKANGEVAAYKIQINAGGGAIILQDDVGNFIELDTVKTHIRLRNKMQTEVNLYENNIKVHCNENHDTTIGNNKTLKIDANCDVKIGSALSVQVGDGCTVKIGGDCQVSVDGSTTWDCADTTFTGNVNIGGALAVTGGSSLGGGGTVTGNLSVSGQTQSGTLNVSGESTLNGGSSSKRIYGA